MIVTLWDHKEQRRLKFKSWEYIARVSAPPAGSLTRPSAAANILLNARGVMLFLLCCPPDYDINALSFKRHRITATTMDAANNWGPLLWICLFKVGVSSDARRKRWVVRTVLKWAFHTLKKMQRDKSLLRSYIHIIFFPNFFFILWDFCYEIKLNLF